jgi:uncharacterized SAM-binding protein YcdF (DUF218 family)
MWRRLRVGALIAALLVILYITYTAYSIISFSNRYELNQTDAAIVLGAAVWEGEPSPVLKERMNHAIWLYKNGYVGKIITTGGLGKGDIISEAEAAKLYAVQQEVHEEDIIMEAQSRITEQNLGNAYAIAKQQQIQSFAIVSDPLHMKRAVRMAEDLGMNAYSSPTQTSAYQSLRTKVPFLLREIFFLIGYEAKV